MLYENLPSEDRARAARAASQFPLRNDYVSLYEASEIRGLSVQELWTEIMAESGLPECDLPVFAPVI
jgi:hypothetical protein